MILIVIFSNYLKKEIANLAQNFWKIKKKIEGDLYF